MSTHGARDLLTVGWTLDAAIGGALIGRGADGLVLGIVTVISALFGSLINIRDAREMASQ